MVDKLVIVLLGTILAASCGQKNENSNINLKQKTGKQFFENSRRDIAKKELHKGIANVRGCTGYFLKNDQNKNIMMTARHCFSYDAVSWCEASPRVQDAFSKKWLKCEKVIIGDKVHDPVIVQLEDQERDRSGDYSLASFMPKKGTYLQMIGRPADKFAPTHSQPVITENCWVLKESSRHPYIGRSHYKHDKADKTFYHNCSTYGGNSGGPMFIEGTKIVVGQPYTYMPKRYKNYGEKKKTAHGAKMSEFVKDFGPLIRSFGIKVSDDIRGKKSKTDFFKKDRKFYTDQSDVYDCHLTVSPKYNTSSSLAELKVKANKIFGCRFKGTYKCNKADQPVCVHKSKRKKYKIEVIDHSLFYIHDLKNERLIRYFR